MCSRSKPAPTLRRKMLDGTNRIVLAADGRIYYTYIKGKVTAYCTHYSDVLLRILQSKCLSPSMSSHVPGKIQFRMHNAKDIKGYTTLAELCCACYYGKITSVDNWVKELARFRCWMRNFDLQIDHADGNQLNCTIYNLSIMKRQTNQSKNSITANIKQPTIMYCGYYGDEYRVAAFFPGIKDKSGERGVKMYLRFDTATDFSCCLREIHGLMGGYGKPIYMSSEEYRNRPCVAIGDTITTIFHQELLAKMDREYFRLCRVGQVKRMYSEAIKERS